MAKETKQTYLIFEELKEFCTKTISVPREPEYIGLSYSRVPKPFAVGEKFAKLHPHQTLGGKAHKGNVEIIEINALGSQAIAKCTLPNCQEMLVLEIKKN